MSGRLSSSRSLDEWSQLLPESDIAIYAASGYGVPSSMGARPAVLVIDVTYNFAGDRSEPILESVKRYPHSCGEVAWRSIAAMKRLIEKARDNGCPIFYTAPAVRKSDLDAGRWANKTSRSRDTGERGHEIVDEIAPAPGDTVVRKAKPSAFFGTPLTSLLVALKVDSLLVCGGTTSGCVRASVIDAFSYNYAVALVEEANFDRSQLVHQVNLFDMQAKYAEVVSLQAAERYLDSLDSTTDAAVR